MKNHRGGEQVGRQMHHLNNDFLRAGREKFRQMLVSWRGGGKEKKKYEKKVCVSSAAGRSLTTKKYNVKCYF